MWSSCLYLGHASEHANPWLQAPEQKGISQDIQVPSKKKKKKKETFDPDRSTLPTCPMGLGMLEIQTASSATAPIQSGDIHHTTASVNVDKMV